MWMSVNAGLTNQAQENAVLNGIVMYTQMLTHDLRRPFQLAQTTMKLLLDDTNSFSSQEKQQIKNQMDSAVIKMDRLFSDLRNLRSQENLSFKQTDLSSFIGNICLAEEAHIKRKGILFEHKIDSNISLVCDEWAIERIFSNILENAIQFSKPKDQIHVKLIKKDHIITLSIFNSGSTISREDVKNIFEPFYTRNQTNGTGLGLAIARQLVLEHKGDIQCLAGDENGVEFKLEFPIT
jgi:signal transduction histidine kinase